MELSKKYKMLLLRAKLHPLQKMEIRKQINKASDLQLVAIHSAITNILKERGILGNE